MIVIVKATNKTRQSLDYDRDLDNKRDKDVTLIGSRGVPLDKDENGNIDYSKIEEALESRHPDNPRFKEAFHIVISFHPDDEPRLDDKYMEEVCRKFLERMEWEESIYTMHRHGEKDNPHVHITMNRVTDDGETIPYPELKKLKIAARDLTLEEGLTLGDSTLEKEYDLFGNTSRYKNEIGRIVNHCLDDIDRIDQLPRETIKYGVETHFKRDENLYKIGISYSFEDENGIRHSYSGSSVDSRLSLHSIERRLEMREELGLGRGEQRSIEIDDEKKPRLRKSEDTSADEGSSGSYGGADLRTEEEKEERIEEERRLGRSFGR